MKAIILSLWFSPLIVFASPWDEYQEALAETGITARPTSPTLGELVFDTNYLADIKELPADRKVKLANQLTKIIPKLAQAQAAQPIIRDERTGPTGQSLKLGILALQEIGSDEQKIETFRKLDLYGESLPDACSAIATCEVVEGVKILKEYAEGQFVAMESQISKGGGRTPEDRVRGKPDVNIYHAIITLAGAYHPDGPVAADKLRDRLLEFCKSHLDAPQLAAVAKDFEKNLGKARLNRENLIRTKQPNNKRESQTEINAETSGNSPVPPSAVSSSKWFWAGISGGVILLAIACRSLFKRRA